jgi:thiopeptide-type bacteriocin biosynthesis protein
MLKRKFIPGSEWLYIKMYTGIKTADVILQEAVNPLLQELYDEKLIKKWFFIRYYDPKVHLRIRFEIADPTYYHQVLSLVNHYLDEYISSGEISELLVDTYQREIERYGEQTMESAEFLFCKSSTDILFEYLDFDDEEKIMVTLFHIEKTLDFLGWSIHEKLDWIKYNNRAFKQEFNADKVLNSQLDKKYRQFSIAYNDFLTSDDYLVFREVILDTIHESEAVLEHIKSSSEDLQDFFSSVFHMHINRMFTSNQRLFEMVIYDYLLRYYKTLSFKNSIN